MKKYYKILLIFLIVFIIVYTLSGYKSSIGIDDLAYCLAIGIDKR